MRDARVEAHDLSLQGGLRWLTPWLGVTILAFLLRIPVPLWPAGFPLLATLSTGLLTLAAWLFVARHAGAARATGMAMLGVTLGWAVEKLGSVTGWLAAASRLSLQRSRITGTSTKSPACSVIDDCPSTITRHRPSRIAQ